VLAITSECSTDLLTLVALLAYKHIPKGQFVHQIQEMGITL